jgi:hypothetical protein
VVVDWMHKLLCLCLATGVVPQDWCSSVIVPLYKGKGCVKECRNYRAISLLSVPGKVYGKILIDKVRNVTTEQMWDVQSGFMSGRGCVDQIFSLRQMVDKKLNVNGKLFCAFVDLEKAYDTVNREKLWNVLGDCRVEAKVVSGVRSLYRAVDIVLE